MTIVSIHSVPRSGSTWLLSIFDSLLQTKCVYQPLWSYEFKNRLSETSTQDDFNQFIEDIKKSKDDYCCMKTNFHTNNGENDILTFPKQDINHVVMKHVTHHYLIEKFIESNKDIKIVRLVRKPELVIESQMKAKNEHLQDWLNGTDKNIFKECYFGFNKWLELNTYFTKLKEKYPDNVYLISYDDLLKNPQFEIEKLFDYCGFKIEESTINFINESMLKHNNYDYSVFRNKEKLVAKECQLDQEIINYIHEHQSQNI